MAAESPTIDAPQIALIREMIDRAAAARESEAIALDVNAAAKLLMVSPSMFRAMHASGELGPAPALNLKRDGRPVVRWLRTELVEWLQAGSPPRTRWLAMRAAAAERRR